MAIEMFKRGSVEMLALLILNEDDAHGYRIVQEIKDRSDGRLIIKEGSLYPILYKLSDEGYIETPVYNHTPAEARTIDPEVYYKAK